ncbi:hypothetical protein O3M35_005640 [Rhynocoris fuscipes]|uniref:Lipase domain-containing protein n=1 Tax=Rhynocoris fuscipes TaxID=488301 RepID=A0AAW1DPA5_9HEMI
MFSQISAVYLFLFTLDGEAQNTFSSISQSIEVPIANSKICSLPASCADRNVKYYIINRQNIRNPYIVNASDGEDVISKAPFVAGYPLKVLAPGLDGYAYNTSTLINYLIPAYYHQPGDFNIIVLDLSEQIIVAGLICPIHFASVDGECLARFLTKIYNYNSEIKLENTHIIGASYGAVVAGFAGNYFGGTLHRITALDPPNILRSVHTEDIEYPLCRKSAKVVDVFHTNMGYLGHWSMLGTVDVIFNSGIIQPGIDKGKFSYTACYHARSVELYMASIIFNRSLLARRCRYSVYEYLIDQSDHLCPLTDDPQYYIVGESMPSE